MPDLGSSNTPVPMPRDFVGGPDKFSVVRIIDGHKAFAVGEEGRNCYYPNGDPDMSSESGEISYDFSPEEY
jgi:hypothetical protein